MVIFGECVVTVLVYGNNESVFPGGWKANNF